MAPKPIAPIPLSTTLECKGAEVDDTLMVLEVGAEGGSVKLLASFDRGILRFCVCSSEIFDREFSGSGAEGQESGWQSEWSSALSALDAYPWTSLYPISAHPMFRNDILAALKQRSHRNPDICFDDWDRLFAEGCEAQFRITKISAIPDWVPEPKACKIASCTCRGKRGVLKSKSPSALMMWRTFPD